MLRTGNKNPLRRPRLVALTGTVALLAGQLLAVPQAQASEVVKLARLVITGARLPANEAAKPLAETLPRVTIEGPRSPDGLKLAVQPRGTRAL